jgi:light-regulated signal transduction histidine kinase (bacteriophytochrome)
VGTLKIGKIAEERKPHLTNQVVGDPRVGDQAWATRERMVAFAGYPLLINDEIVGVLAMFSRRALSDADFEGLGTVAQAIALGIARHRSEAALQRQVHELAQLAAALERSNRELDQFAYVASHDLKAPLRGIANLAQWIEEDLGSSIGGTTREHLMLLRGRVHRMEQLIDGILEYSRAGRTRTDAERVNVRRLVADVIELLAVPGDVNVDVVEPMPVVTTERLPLQQVLQNLIGNAVKHAARQDATIRIAATADAGGATFLITDNGPGIDQAYHDRVWAIFQTLQPRDKVEGAGIGLAIVKKTVEARGGRVWLESAPGRGATFGFWWPADTKGAQ